MNGRPAMSIEQRLAAGGPLILDGALGTELAQRNVDVDTPAWSAQALVDAPETVAQIHAEYRAAGAEVLTADTFRTHARNLAAIGWSDRADELTETAVRLARQAAEHPKHEGRAWVAGSIGPLEDCYRPENTPDESALRREHLQAARRLAQAGVDVMLVETMPTVREAAAAAQAVREVDGRLWASFVCRADGRLWSGETLEEAVREVAPFRPQAVLVNCCPADDVPGLLRGLQTAVDRFFPRRELRPYLGAYPNVGRCDAAGKWSATAAESPKVFAAWAEQWTSTKSLYPAKIVGGCCGTTPEHIRRMAQAIEKRST